MVFYDEIDTCCSYKTRKFLLRTLDLYTRFKRFPALDIPNTDFKSIARCDKFDAFDEKIGKEIAGSKVDIKYHKAMAKKYGMIMGILDKAKDEINKLYNKHETEADNIEENIKKYTEEKRK